MRQEAPRWVVIGPDHGNLFGHGSAELVASLKDLPGADVVARHHGNGRHEACRPTSNPFVMDKSTGSAERPIALLVAVTIAIEVGLPHRVDEPGLAEVGELHSRPADESESVMPAFEEVLSGRAADRQVVIPDMWEFFARLAEPDIHERLAQRHQASGLVSCQEVSDNSLEAFAGKGFEVIPLVRRHVEQPRSACFARVPADPAHDATRVFALHPDDQADRRVLHGVVANRDKISAKQHSRWCGCQTRLS